MLRRRGVASKERIERSIYEMDVDFVSSHCLVGMSGEAFGGLMDLSALFL